jgi:L-ascorbate metabolism protein UlaG (beta-lactamase superfamily)
MPATPRQIERALTRLASTVSRALTVRMRITKHEHACLRLEAEGKQLIIDPGSFTLPLSDLHGLAAIVITHEHPDHWTPEHLERLRRDAPGAGLRDRRRRGVRTGRDRGLPGDTVTAGPFTMTFHGGRHSVIHSSIPVIDNVGVLVNDAFYYPGDSYAVPANTEVDLLAAPIGAPWLKIGEAIDFVLAVKPRRAFGTHDMTLSRVGLDMHRARLAWATEQNGGEFVTLDPGDSYEM